MSLKGTCLNGLASVLQEALFNAAVGEEERPTARALLQSSSASAPTPAQQIYGTPMSSSGASTSGKVAVHFKQR